MTDEALKNLLAVTGQLSKELNEVNALIDEVLAQINEALEMCDRKSHAVVHCTLFGKEPMQLSDLEAATDFKKLCSDLNITPCLHYEPSIHAYFCKLDSVVVTSNWLAEHQCEDPLFYDLGGFQFYLGSQVDYLKVE